MIRNNWIFYYGEGLFSIFIDNSNNNEKNTFLFQQLSTSDSHAVTLRSVTKDLTGNFQCEVSEDAPLFHTDIRLAHMQVIELPKADPFLQVDKQIIGPTDFFKAICTVGKSYPPANITWFVNGRRVSTQMSVSLKFNSNYLWKHPLKCGIFDYLPNAVKKISSLRKYIFEYLVNILSLMTVYFVTFTWLWRS